MMNLIEATNYYLEEEDNKILQFIKTIIKTFKIDLSQFADPAKLKAWIAQNADDFIKANQLYTKAVGMHEGYLQEGLFDKFRGLNKSVLGMFVIIAICGMINKAHASPADLAKSINDIAHQVQVLDTDPSDTHHAGFDVHVTGDGHSEHVKKIVSGLDDGVLKKLKQLGDTNGYGSSDVKNVLKIAIAHDFAKDPHLKDRINGLTAQELEMLIDNALVKM